MRPAPFANAFVVLYAISALLGAVVYLYFRVDVRPQLERDGYWQTLGLFDLKEHFVAIGLGLLPAYWVCWRRPIAGEPGRTRAVLTAILCLHRLVGLPDGPRLEQHPGLWGMTSSPTFRRFAFAYGTAFALFYVVALFRDLALFTVYPSLGIVILGTHHSRDVVDPAIGFVAPEMYWYGWTATAALGALVFGFARAMGTTGLVGMGVDYSRGCDDCLCLPHTSLVSTLAPQVSLAQRMSGLGQKRTRTREDGMSAYPLKADIPRVCVQCPLSATNGHSEEAPRAFSLVLGRSSQVMIALQRTS